jgi:hypothetical protein
MFVIGLGH